MPHHRDQTEQLWKLVTQHLRTSVSEDAYTRWFSNLKLISASDAEIELQAPDTIHQLWIEMNYMPVLKAAFGAITGMEHQILLEVESPPVAVNGYGPAEAAPDPAPLSNTVSVMEVDEPVENLSHAMTFENFIVGSANSFAHAAAISVSEKPGRSYNPLFLFGGSGLGKTHLMQAIGARVREGKPRARVVYSSCEEFINQYIQAVQTNSLARFRKRFRQADVLLIDDVQFLEGKVKSQEEFFHTFNAVLENHKQIVLSSDRPPAEIKNLENRLVTRFEWGHMTELMPPDEIMRVAILRQRAEHLEVDVPAHLLEFIASKISSSIRRLQGALVRVSSWISLHGEMSQQQAEELLRDLLAQEAKNVLNIERIQQGVAQNFDVRLGDMVSRKRPASLVLPRQVAMYLARELTELSYQDLGSAFGGRDHGTIMHACRNIEKKMRADEKLRLRVQNIETQLKRSV
jgi:chromosomal replication initiator protein